MKKTIAIIIHLLAVLLFAAGIVVLHKYTRSKIGISWTETNTFENSVLFSEMVSDDIAKLKRYAVLKNAFEEEADGELQTEKLIATAQTSNGAMNYSLSELVSVAGRYGYTIDEKNHSINVNQVSNQAQPYELRIVYKAFDPFYLENLETGPTAGLTNIRDLSIEAVRCLAEYYRLRDIYDQKDSNFLYYVNFRSDDDYEIMMDNTSKSADELKALGRYLIVTEDNLVETNIVPQPADILDETNCFALDGSDGDAIRIGIDTEFIYNDRYKAASDNYGNNLKEIRNWIYAIVAAAALALVSLVFAIRGFGPEDRSEYTSDRIPLEALIFLYACLSVIVFFIYKFTVYGIVEEFLQYADWEFWRVLGKGVIIWLCCAAIAASMYRRSLHGGWFKYSLASGMVRALENEEDGSAVWNALKEYLVVIAVNLAAAAFITNCHFLRIEGEIYTIAMAICTVLIIAFDLFVFYKRCRAFRQRDEIRKAIGELAHGNVNIKLDESRFDESSKDLVKNMNNISVGMQTAINEQVKADKLKADLITNVSHDIRTPLTSIINYVDLLKRENIEDERVAEYINVLDKKSDRLKKLTDDLIEASKASSGNIKMDLGCIDMAELAGQAIGELSDKFSQRSLELEVTTPDHPAYVLADGRYLWRVFENILGNAAKYSLESTRVYAEVRELEDSYVFTLKNISANKLNISPDELTERFVRGDLSRNTEGSGLGLNIAQSLTILMGGELKIEIDGDLYKANVIMKKYVAGDSEPSEDDVQEDNVQNGI